MFEGLTLDSVSQKNEMIRYWTGFSNYEQVKYFFRCLGPAAFALKYQCQKLSSEDHLFLCLMKLRHNKEDVELGFFFGISTFTVHRIFHTWLNFLYYQLLEVDMWIDRPTTNVHMPKGFKRLYPQTRTIIDATEVPIERPSNVKDQRSTWSSYKNKNTLKVIITLFDVYCLLPSVV